MLLLTDDFTKQKQGKFEKTHTVFVSVKYVTSLFRSLKQKCDIKNPHLRRIISNTLEVIVNDPIESVSLNHELDICLAVYYKGPELTEKNLVLPEKGIFHFVMITPVM